MVKTVTQSSYTKTVVVTETISPPETSYHPSSTREVGEPERTSNVEEPTKTLEVGECPGVGEEYKASSDTLSEVTKHVLRWTNAQ